MGSWHKQQAKKNQTEATEPQAQNIQRGKADWLLWKEKQA